jgi:hypothetical protein
VGMPCWLLVWNYVLTLCYLPSPIVYMWEETTLIFIIIIVLYNCTCIEDASVHEEP